MAGEARAAGWRGRRPRLRTLRPLLVPPLLFALLWLVVDVPAALARLADADLCWLLAGLLLVQLQILVSALRWRATAARLGQRLGVGRVVREYYVATLLNQVLPGGVAGDAARVFRNRGTGARPARSAEASRPVEGPPDVPSGSAGDGSDRRASVPLARVAQGVVLERLAGQVSLVAASCLGIAAWPLLWHASPPRAGLLALASAFGLVLAAVATVALLTRYGPTRLARFVAGVRPAIVRCWFADGMWLVQGVSSVVVTASYLGVFVVAALAIDAPLPPAAVLTVVPLALLSMLLPFSVGGWGLREAAAAALWPLVGLGADAGVATSVLYGLLSLAGSLPALAFVLRPERAPSPERAAEG